MSNVIIKVSESKMNEMKAAYQANLLQKKNSLYKFFC